MHVLDDWEAHRNRSIWNIFVFSSDFVCSVLAIKYVIKSNRMSQFQLGCNSVQRKRGFAEMFFVSRETSIFAKLSWILCVRYGDILQKMYALMHCMSFFYKEIFIGRFSVNANFDEFENQKYAKYAKRRQQLGIH